MEKAQKHMGGLSEINNNNNYYENDSDGFWFVGGFVGVVIVLSLIASFFNWLGGVLSDLWSKGIIQMILAIAGIGGTSYGIYKLYENGFFENIEKYFEKKKIENDKKQKSISKVKSNEKVITEEKEKRNVGDPITMYSYKFDDASYLAKVVVLEICDQLLTIEWPNTNEIYCYSNKLERGYNINLDELRQYVYGKLSTAEIHNKNKEYVKHYWLYE